MLLPFSIEKIPLTVVTDEKVTEPVPDRVRLLKVSPGVTDTAPPFNITEPVLAVKVPPVLVRLPPIVIMLLFGLKVPVLVRLPPTVKVPVLPVNVTVLMRLPVMVNVPELALKVPLFVNVPPAFSELVPVASNESDAPVPIVILLQVFGIPSA